MSGWASLSGYLYLKPGGGGLSILKSRRRLWCILEESQGRLLYFKSEDDARSKPPLGYVELRGAAITLDMDNHNQFVIIVEGKEILLTAENHESMMIWLMGLQARRDQFALSDRSRTSSTSTETDLDPDINFLEVVESRERSASDLAVIRERNDYSSPTHQLQRRHKALEATMSLQGQGQGLTPGFLGMSPDWRRDQLKKMGDTIDSGQPSAKTYSAKDRSRSLPPLLEESALNYLRNQSNRESNVSTEVMEMMNRTQPSPSQVNFTNWSSSSTSTDNSDDVGIENGHRTLRRSSSAKGSPDLRIRRGSLKMDTNQDGEEVERVTDLEKELMATKCELAKVLNRQSCFQEILKQKDEIIEDLDGKLGSKGGTNEGYDSKKRVTALSKEHQERVRVLQNQNRFLNEEVRRLAKLRCQEHDKIKTQDGKVRSLEADIEVWKLEYISLIQSSIRFTGTDTMDDAELSLFGGDRHKHRILSLLEEARKINPSLPTYEHLASGEVHVDCYGFKHHFVDDGLLLHYLCQELSQHFLCQASSYEKHQKNWLLFLKNSAKNLTANKKDLKDLVRNGIPDPHRKQMWRLFVMCQVEDIVLEKGAHYYRSLCSAVPDSPMAARYRKQISLDLMRTMPSNVKFSTPGSKGIMDLQDVLLAFCIHNPQVGYCQGMNFLVAMALLFMDAQDAFWALVAVTERYHSPSYFDHNLLGAQADQSVLHDLMTEKMPELAKHLDAIDIEISTVTLNWFLAIFFDAVPFQTLLRVWDCFLLEGPKVLFRFSLAILHIHSKEIIMKCDTISVMRHLKACARITYDVDGLVRAAFKTLKPFPRRQDIVSKQTCYLNALKEKYRWRDMQKVAFAERESLYLSMECDAENYTGFECCTVTKPGEAWVAYGVPPNAKICIVDCREQTMTDINITFDTRVMSMTSVKDEIVLIGTLSWFIYAYNQDTRQLAWQQRVHDAVLSLLVYRDDDNDQSNRLFAGLADGTVAVFETLSLSCTNYDLFYLPIGQSPVTCLKLIGNQLWCACGNMVSIIHASTLDPMDRFTVSSNPYDTVLSLVPGIPGVWISVRGSSVLELWDPMSLSCKMLYDTRTGRYPNLRKEDDSYFNAARITSILALDHSVWVGTGEGTLITFDVFSKNNKTPSVSSPFMTEGIVGGELEVPSWRSSGHHNDCDSYSRLVEVERKVRDLYIQRLSEDGCVDEKDILDSGTDAGTDSNVSSPQKVSENEKKGEADKVTNVDGSVTLKPGEKCPVTVDNTNTTLTTENSAATGQKTNVCKKNSSDSAITDTSRGTVMSTETDTSTKTNNSEVKSTQIAENMNERLSGQELSKSSESSDNSLNTTLREGLTSPESETVKRDHNHNPTHSTVYYLYQPDTDDKVSVSPDNSLQNSADAENGNIVITSNFRNGRKVTTTLNNQRDRATRKSEDSGISCDKAHEGTNSSCKMNKRFPLEKASSFEHSLLNGNNNTSKQPTAEELKNMKNKFHNNSASEKNLEGCINAASEFYVKEKENGSGVDDLRKRERNMSCECNGRSVSEDSNKTNESDDVFHAVDAVSSKASEKNSQEENISFGKESKPVILEGVDSNVNSAVNNSAELSENSLSKTPLLNGYANSVNDKEAKCVDSVESEVAETEKSKEIPVESVKTLAARFEANVSKNNTVVEKKPLRRTKSLKMNFRPSVESNLSKNDEFLSNGALKTVQTEDPQKSNHNELSENSNTSKDKEQSMAKVSTTESAKADAPKDSATPSKGHQKLCRLSPKKISSKPTSNLSAAAIQLGKELENSKPLVTSENQTPEDKKPQSDVLENPSGTESLRKPKSEPQLRSIGLSDVDTKFYGDSDEESYVHEARVQNFKDSYRRKASVSAKARQQTDQSSEISKGSSNNPTPLQDDSKDQKMIDSTDSNSSSTNTSASGIGTPSKISNLSQKVPLSSTCRQGSEASLSLDNVQPRDPEAQYRLDYTNIHVDTDLESLGMSSASCDGELGEGEDSHPGSRRLSGLSTSSDMKDQRLNQFLRDTASNFNSQFGLPLEEDKINGFLTTPTMSEYNSVSWSSYDEISTPPQGEEGAVRPSGFNSRFPRPTFSQGSRATSIASTVDVCFGADLSLLSKNKVSDKPVKHLVATECNSNPVVLSFAGCHSDDEAVLIWSREANETLWTNCPVFEYNPKTKMATLPRYMRTQLSSSSSTLSSPRQRLASMNSN